MDEPQSGTPQVPTNKPKAGGQLLKLTLGDWWNDDTFELSAALAFYTTFSIAPVLLIAIGIASFFLARVTAENEIVSEIQKRSDRKGHLPSLLFWVYYSALIGFFRAEFTQVYARRYGSGIQPQRHAERIGRKSDTI
jgi:uncharacterized BrkB/YihY/UPF0761 family membrane protein